MILIITHDKAAIIVVDPTSAGWLYWYLPVRKPLVRDK